MKEEIIKKIYSLLYDCDIALLDAIYDYLLDSLYSNKKKGE